MKEKPWLKEVLDDARNTKRNDEILAEYRRADAEMREVAHQIDNHNWTIQCLQRDIKKLEERLRLLVRLPRESHGPWSKVP